MGSPRHWRAHRSTARFSSSSPISSRKPAFLPSDAGETVCRRAGAASTATVATGGRYVVRSGDTLGGIAAYYRVNMYSIHGYRSGNPALIYPGETLYW